MSNRPERSSRSQRKACGQCASPPRTPWGFKSPGNTWLKPERRRLHRLLASTRAGPQARRRRAAAAVTAARARVGAAKRGLGERGTPWWEQDSDARRERWTTALDELDPLGAGATPWCGARMDARRRPSPRPQRRTRSHRPARSEEAGRCHRLSVSPGSPGTTRSPRGTRPTLRWPDRSAVANRGCRTSHVVITRAAVTEPSRAAWQAMLSPSVP